jgi:hypothetical protein
VPVRWEKNKQFQPKPCCHSCGWNVARARKHSLHQIAQIVVMAGLIALYAWAVTDMRWSMPLVAGWMLIVIGLPIVTRLRRLPSSRPAPPLQPLASIANFNTAKLDTVAPRLNIILEGLIVVASSIAILFLPTELNPARRRLPGVRHELLFVMLTTIFVAYQLGVHGIQFFRLVSSIWLERHLAKRAMTGKGRIIDSSSGTIRYEFLDYTSRLLRGMGRDYTLGLYEDMPVSVLYDPDNPSLNMPTAALQFHRQGGVPVA